MCGTTYRKQKGNFPFSQSVLYQSNNRYAPVCYECADKMFNNYYGLTGDRREAMKRICLKFDIYWNAEIFDLADSCGATQNLSFVRQYITKSNLFKYKDKTYDDTINDDIDSLSKGNVMQFAPVNIEEHIAGMETPSQEMVEFWGEGLEADMYFDLDRRYQKWTRNLDQPVSAAAEALYKQICISEMRINKGVLDSKGIEAAQKSIIDSLGALNIRPDKVVVDTTDEDFDNAPFGVLIRIKENTAPIPKPLPELEDVDGLRKYISVWFLGHLCKMLGIRNGYSKMYEDEMERLRVTKPEMVDEDEDSPYNDIFEGFGGDG